ncbi:MAG: hypothetical protein RL145_1588, partial [Pseudomonadota bacterium]
QSAESIATISKQMQELADRLAASHDNALQSLASSVGGRDDNTRQMLDDALGQVRTEIQSVDARVQALIEPLQRDFAALGERLEKAEQGGATSFAEPIYDPNHAVDLGGPAREDIGFVNPMDLPNDDGFGFESSRDPMAKPEYDDPFFMDRPPAKPPAAPAGAARRGSFGSPFPDGEDGDSLNDFADLRDDVPDPLAGGQDPFGGEMGAMALDPTSPIDDDFDDGLSILDNDWDGPNNNTSTAPDYLVAARRAANQAAAAREAAQTKKKPPLSLKMPAGKDKKAEAPKAKPSAKAPPAAKEAAKDGAKPKAPLSPVGIAAAAALVATGGFAVFSQLRPSSNADEKPAALNQENVPLPPELAAQAGVPAPVEGAVPAPGAEATPPAPIDPNAATMATPAAPAPTAPTAPAATATPAPAKPATAIPTPPPQLPKAQLVPPTTKAATPAVTPPAAKPTPSAQQLEAARVMAAADAQARAAKARAEAERQRLRSASFNAQRPAAAPAPRVATVAKAPAAPAVAPPRVASVAGPAAANTAAAAAPTRVPVAAPAASAPAAAAPTQPKAVTPVANASGSLFDQAVAREQAGDAAGSVALLRRAADGGDTRAMNRLARKFENGDGVPKDLAQARALTERAAARGSRQAMHNLGVYYANGDGVPQNMARAAESFRRAAQRGVTDSQFNLGAMAEQGLGGPKSDVQAYYWFALAARGGDRDAAAKVKEIGARLTPEQRAAQDQLVAQFRPENGSQD